ncbi:MAG: hypothetical protein IJ237_07650 [Oscillospiraceae bacterium]|nr:hypothetical protein [Oscillospiraceae bacterium]
MSQRRDDFEDDGRTIANMNVDGMPWYEPNRQDPDSTEKLEMTREEQRWLIGGALKAALFVGAVFAVVYFLFLLFCTKIWFA